MDWNKRQEELENLIYPKEIANKIFIQEKTMIREFVGEIIPIIKIRLGLGHAGQMITLVKDINKLLKDMEIDEI